LLSECWRTLCWNWASPRCASGVSLPSVGSSAKRPGN